MRRVMVGAVLAIAVAMPAWGQVKPDYDEFNAKDIMRTCAPCHGVYGEGGKGYPRLAGFNADYLAEQIRAFKSRKRENIPMIPYATDRELPERDISDITKYLSSIKLDTKLPELSGRIDGLERLQQAKMVVQIPKWDGNIENGKKIYDENCAECHGNKGQGRVKKPPLAGQYSEYLEEQIKNFVKGKRQHEDTPELFEARRRGEIDDILAYLSVLDD
jgi:cytochrome c553